MTTAVHEVKDKVTRMDSGPIATLILDDAGSRNSLSRRMMAELQAALDDIAQNDKTHVVVIRAEGPVFSSGHNLKEVMAMAENETLDELFAECSRLMQTVVSLPQPVIGRVDGVATAAGTQLVASCDLAYASTTSKFATSGVNFGFFCTTPGVALGRNVARKQAMEMLLSGDFISAPRAVEIGLLNATLPVEALDDQIEVIADNIANKSFDVIRLGKQAFYRQMQLPLDEAYNYASDVMCENMRLEDAREGLTAFFEKRNPDWRK